MVRLEKRPSEKLHEGRGGKAGPCASGKSTNLQVTAQPNECFTIVGSYQGILEESALRG